MTPQQLTFLAAFIAACSCAASALIAYRRCQGRAQRVTLGFVMLSALYLATVYLSVVLGVSHYLLKSGILTGSGMTLTLVMVTILIGGYSDRGC